MWSTTCSQSRSLFHMWRGSGWDGLGESGGTPACTVHQVYADSVCNQVGEPERPAEPGVRALRQSKTFPVESHVIFEIISSCNLASESKQRARKKKKRNTNNRVLCFLFNVRFNPICRNRRDLFSVKHVSKCMSCENLIRDKRVAVWMRVSGKMG